MKIQITDDCGVSMFFDLRGSGKDPIVHFDFDRGVDADGGAWFSADNVCEILPALMCWLHENFPERLDVLRGALAEIPNTEGKPDADQ